VVIEELVLDDLQQVITFVKEHERDFIAAATKSSERRIAEDLRMAQKEYEQGQVRISTLDKILRKLYEDRVMRSHRDLLKDCVTASSGVKRPHLR
jgi:site-specific DNA recombinase